MIVKLHFAHTFMGKREVCNLQHSTNLKPLELFYDGLPMTRSHMEDKIPWIMIEAYSEHSIKSNEGKYAQTNVKE